MVIEVNGIDVSISERTPVWTPEQTSAMINLLRVDCNIKNGCGNQWCAARERIKRAFGIQLAEDDND